MTWFSNLFSSASEEAAKVYGQAKKSVAEVTEKVVKPMPKPMLPGAAPEPAGKTTTGGKRHRSRRRHAKKRKTRRSRRA
jgi:hypothetical protein